MVKFERREKHDLSFHEDQIKLAKIMMDQARTTLEFLYYMMRHKRDFSFTMILLSADNVELESLIKQQKRETDILLEISKKDNLYMLLCQSTGIEGGYQFAEILMTNIRMDGGERCYCVETEVVSTLYTVQEVIFTMVEKYINIKRKREFDKVFFTKLGKIEYTEN